MLLVAKGHLKVDEASRYFRNSYTKASCDNRSCDEMDPVASHPGAFLHSFNFFASFLVFVDFLWTEKGGTVWFKCFFFFKCIYWIFMDGFEDFFRLILETHNLGNRISFIDFFFTNGGFVDVLVRARFCSLPKLKRAGSCCFFVELGSRRKYEHIWI